MKTSEKLKVKIRTIHILSVDNQRFSSVPEIANKLAATFSQVSSAANYLPNFLEVKTTSENYSLNFTSNNEENYNSVFTIHELDTALSKVKNTARGPDGICCQMLKKMAEKAKECLLNLFNQLWQSNFFPQTWREAVMIVFPKPNKTPSNAENYRPIALTSCLCKTLE